ncbi:unnamed protein product [Arctogadus glacialis]
MKGYFPLLVIEFSVGEYAVTAVSNFLLDLVVWVLRDLMKGNAWNMREKQTRKPGPETPCLQPHQSPFWYVISVS